MNLRLEGKQVAILAADGFEQSELIEPRRALEAEGAQVYIVSLEKGLIRGWTAKNWGESVTVDVGLDTADPTQYDALLLPGGVMNPDQLRRNARAVQFVSHFVEAGKPIGAICHGPQILIEAEAVDGRLLTSYDSLRTDLENAGAHWVDQEVVVDEGLVTSRTPSDLPAFNRNFIEEIAEGVHPSISPREIKFPGQLGFQPLM
ncbi:MAG TPA: type 1 glutamine amidotransferase domain-containing protein [Candidatus Limnocylindria bacterium]|nr:type 1 glutamine amidotransferase domain-containing protein [Candidatus Limnocylindria bacterium]